MNIFAQRTWYNRHIVGRPTVFSYDGRNPACIYYLNLGRTLGIRTFEPAKVQFVQSLGRVVRRSEPNSSISNYFCKSQAKAIARSLFRSATPYSGTPTAK